MSSTQASRNLHALLLLLVFSKKAEQELQHELQDTSDASEHNQCTAAWHGCMLGSCCSPLLSSIAARSCSSPLMHSIVTGCCPSSTNFTVMVGSLPACTRTRSLLLQLLLLLCPATRTLAFRWRDDCKDRPVIMVCCAEVRSAGDHSAGARIWLVLPERYVACCLRKDCLCLRFEY